LADKNGNLVENANKIPVTIAIYSSESVPKFIDSNTAGINKFCNMRLKLY